MRFRPLGAASPSTFARSPRSRRVMQRRDFLAGCSLAIGASGIGAIREALASVTPRVYARSLLVDVHGEPIKASRLLANTNYVFQ